MEEVQPNVIPEVPVKPPNKWSKIVLISVFGLVLTTGLVFAGIQINKKQTSQIAIQPTPALAPLTTLTSQPETNRSSDETANWKAFQGQSFSFKYPDSWKLEPSNNYLTTSRPTTKKAGGDYTPGSGWIFFEPSKDSPQKVIDSITGVDKKEQVVINGYSVTKLTGYTGVAGSVYFVTAVFDNNGEAFTISLSTQDTDLEKSLTIEFDQILSTFRFLE